MQAEFSNTLNTGLVKLSGGFNAVSVEPFRRQWTDWFERHPELRDVVLDFSGVDMLDSAGLGMLIGLLKQVGARGGVLRLAAIPKRVRLVFEITRTQRLFAMFDHVEAALAPPA